MYYKPSKPINPYVIEPSKLQLAIDFPKSFLHLSYWRHHHWTASEKPPIDLDLRLAPIVSKPINSQTLKNGEVMVQISYQWYVRLERKKKRQLWAREPISYRTDRYGWYLCLGQYKNTDVSCRFKYQAYRVCFGHSGVNTEFQPISGYQTSTSFHITLNFCLSLPPPSPSHTDDDEIPIASKERCWWFIHWKLGWS